MQFVQVCRELESLYYTIKEVGLLNKKTELEISLLRSSGDSINAIEAEIKELGLERTRLVAIGARRELEALIVIYDRMPHFTRAQIDESQSDYWQARLTRQANLQIMSSGANWAHLEALDQIGILKPMIEAQKMKELK